MGSPITWQNVTQGDAGNAWRAMDSAQRSINGAFEGLQGIVKGSEDVQARNDIAVKNNNSQDYLNKLATAFKSPEDLAAGLKDGRVDALKASYGNAINHEQVRGAADALLNQRYKQAQDAIGYQTVMRNETTAPAVDKLRSALLSGNKEDETAARKDLANAGYRDFSTQDTFARNLHHENLVREEEGKAWKRDQGRFDREGVKQEADISYQKGMLGVSQGQLANSVAQTGLQRQQLDMTRQDRLDQRLATAIDTLGKSKMAEAGSLEGYKAVIDSINSTFKDADSNANARQAFGQILQKYPGISTADAMAAVTTQDENRIYKLSALVRGNTVERAGEFSGTPEALSRTKDQSLQRSAAEELYKNARAAQMSGPLPPPALTLKPRVNPDAAPTVPNPVMAPVVQSAMRSGFDGAQRDREMEIWNRAIGGGGANAKRSANLEAARTDVTANFEDRLRAISRSSTKAEVGKSLDWMSNAADQGLLSNAQLVELRKARQNLNR